MRGKIRILMNCRKYKKIIIRKQQNYDEMVKACSQDSNAVIIGDRPKLITFMDALKMVLFS